METINLKTVTQNTLVKRKAAKYLNRFNNILLYLLASLYKIVVKKFHRSATFSGNFLIATEIYDNDKLVYCNNQNEKTAWYIDPDTNKKVIKKLNPSTNNQRQLYPFQNEFLIKFAKRNGIDVSLKIVRNKKKITGIFSDRFNIKETESTVGEIYTEIFNDIKEQDHSVSRSETYTLMNTLYKPLPENQETEFDIDTDMEMDIDEINDISRSENVFEIPVVFTDFYPENYWYFNQESLISGVF